MTLCMAIGGPIDGLNVTVPEGEHTYSHEGPLLTFPDPPVRRGHKVYLYEVDDKYRRRMHYVGEDVVMEDDEEVKAQDGTS